MEPPEYGRLTATQHQQCMVEYKIFEMFNLFMSIPQSAQKVMLEIQRDTHIEYLTKGLGQLNSSFVVLDSNRPWLCYWILHSIALLGESVEPELEKNVIDFLSRCQHPSGGYGGGPGQLPHLATTYAAVNSLITLGSAQALSSINRDKTYEFLLKIKDPTGAFRMHDGGEIDVRACYTAISVASALNILDCRVAQNVGDYILSCQTYEGGIAGEPGSEAHGGYTFCGLAAMVLIDEVHRLDLPKLINWVVFRQGIEGGFQGRTNKLVDGCYSFWQGAIFALAQQLHSVIYEQLLLSDDADESSTDSAHSLADSDNELSLEENSFPADLSCCINQEDGKNVVERAKYFNIGLRFAKQHAELEPLFQSMALQQYIILCCQDEEGGLRDKPGKHKDYYHTCYCLSGLSVCQYSLSNAAGSLPLPRAVLGPHSNLLEPIHPLFNVVLERFYEAHKFFSML
ncbi:protein farnesyltransferase subunit beta [Impatiens glandulifera]|uniref:protein farnesyltransferase subunit beta n=1 Tax=Impatiens glandulifera TaxID=253017 RepID=UPI001FB18D6A|nr:protein farnesyltransferase subunit beta [Impatiens glandulifera]